jgi:hypothetical protein
MSFNYTTTPGLPHQLFAVAWQSKTHPEYQSIAFADGQNLNIFNDNCCVFTKRSDADKYASRLSHSQHVKVLTWTLDASRDIQDHCVNDDVDTNIDLSETLEDV